jgi:hypothetical protein
VAVNHPAEELATALVEPRGVEKRTATVTLGELTPPGAGLPNAR